VVVVEEDEEVVELLRTSKRPACRQAYLFV
jgi:hypothetical protein